MVLNKLTLRDKNTFRRFLGLDSHELSVYAFENIYIWKGLFEIFWSVIEGNLCIFFKDKIGCFLYLPPLGKKISKQSLAASFEIMDEFNRNNKDISRIENIEEADLGLYRDLGYKVQEKYCEYLCARNDLAKSRGNKFKHKRTCCNYFIKHYEFEYLPFTLRQHKESCLKLYAGWASERSKHNQDSLYQGMLKDSGICLKTLLDSYEKVDFVGRVVKIDKKIKGFTLGFALNKDIFCIFYEITDLAVKGLAQFIFREFCRELADYKYINIMDDSGLENLKRVKLSYRPLKLVPAYLIKRKSEYEYKRY